MNYTVLPLISGLALIAAPAVAQENSRRPAIFAALMECRKLPDAERLACLDRQVALLDEAERKQELVVVDKADVQRTRRSLFGLSLPSLKLLGSSDNDSPAFQEIEATLKEVKTSGTRWLFILDDGTTWAQTDDREIDRRPRPGHKIRIRKAAMGSFFANVEQQPALRVRRLN